MMNMIIKKETTYATPRNVSLLFNYNEEDKRKERKEAKERRISPTKRYTTERKERSGKDKRYGGSDTAVFVPVNSSGERLCCGCGGTPSTCAPTP